MLALLGLFLAAIGAFDTDGAEPWRRFAYWLPLIAAAGIVHAMLERQPSVRAVTPAWARAALTVGLMTLILTPLVWLASVAVFGASASVSRLAALTPGVLVVSAAIALLLALSRPPTPPAVAAEPPVPSAGTPTGLAALLPLPLRRSALVAVEAEDHYLRVHTEAGSALIRMKMADALSVLEGVAGFQTHRSWWVAEAAVVEARWRKGRGALRLRNGLEVPVSRSFAPRLARPEAH